MSEGTDGSEAGHPTRVRLQLAEIVAADGREILDDPRRVKAMLADTVVGAVREINLINIALLEGVPARLIAATEPLRLQTEIENLIRQLERNNALHRQAAEWSVRSCGWALGLVPAPSELESGPEPAPDDVPAPAPPPVAAPPPGPAAPAPSAAPPSPEPAAPPPSGPVADGLLLVPEPPAPPFELPVVEPAVEAPAADPIVADPVVAEPPAVEAPAVEPPAPPSPPPAARAPREPREPRGPRKGVPVAAIVGAVAVVLLVAILGGVLLLGGSSGSGTDKGNTGGDGGRALAASVEPTNVTCPGPATKSAAAALPVTWGPSPAPLDGALQTNPAQAYRKFVVATDRGEVAALSMEDGSVLFRDRLNGPVVGEYGQEGAVYYGTTAGGLYRVDPTAAANARVTMVLKSSRPLGPVLVENGRAYVGQISGDGGLLVVDLRSGTVARTIPTAGAVFGQPRVDRTTNAVYFAATGGVVYRLPLPGTGNEVVKQFKIGGRIEAGVRVGGGRLVVATTDGVVETLNATDGSKVWRTRLPKGGSSSVPGVFSRPTVGFGTTVVGTSDCRIFALGATGTVIWQVELAHSLRAAPLLIAGTVVAADTAGCVDLLKLPPDPGHQIFRSTQPCPKGAVLSMAGTKREVRVGTGTGQIVVLPMVQP